MGRIGKEGNGLFSLTGQPNAMGGREVGGLANMLPSHRDLLNPSHREEVQAFWGGTKISDKPGFTATEMFQALADGRMKAIWIVTTNPMVSLPDLNMVEKGLQNAKFVVVQNISNRSDTVKSLPPVSFSRLFTNFKFYTPNQRARIHAVPDENLSEKLNEDFPLILTTGLIRDQWHTMTKTGKVNKLNQHIAQPYLEIHPKNAEARGIKEGQVVEIETIRGRNQVKAKITEDIKQGVCFMPTHFGKILGNAFGRTNNLTNTLVDSCSKEPDFKFSAVQIKAY